MAEITVRAETNTLGMTQGDVLTVEDSPFLRNVIAGGRLSLVDSTCADTDTAASRPAPNTAGPDAPPDRPAAKNKRRAEQPADDVVEVEVEAVAIRPPGDPDAILADALVTVRPPEYPPAA